MDALILSLRNGNGENIFVFCQHWGFNLFYLFSNQSLLISANRIVNMEVVTSCSSCLRLCLFFRATALPPPYTAPETDERAF